MRAWSSPRSARAWASALAVLAGGPRAANAQPPIFADPVNYSAAASFVAVADFNRDGLLDVASADYNGTISVLRGNGDGTFQAAVNYSAGSGVMALVVGDFNNDGFPDLATANSETFNNHVSILLNNGDGTFSSLTHYAAGDGPQAIVVGDFNRDGTPDLATANLNGNDVTVMLNSYGALQAPVHYAVSGSPLSLAAADLNRDGFTDLIVGNNSVVSVLTGAANGTFRAAVNFNTGGGPVALMTKDFNDDGWPDLAVLAQSDNADGWNNSSVTASLTATDPEPSDGIRRLFYSVDGGTTFTSVNGGSASVMLSTNGPTTLTFYAEDNAGNVETPKSVSVKIDPIAPTTTASVSSPSPCRPAWSPSRLQTLYPA